MLKTLLFFGDACFFPGVDGYGNSFCAGEFELTCFSKRAFFADTVPAGYGSCPLTGVFGGAFV